MVEREGEVAALPVALGERGAAYSGSTNEIDIQNYDLQICFCATNFFALKLPETSQTNNY